MSTNNNTLIKKLPDAYAKHSDTNNYKLLNLAETELNALREDIAKIELLTSIANAAGETLDRFGEMLDVKRGGFDDDKYRYVLQTEIAQNTVAGDFNNIVGAIIKMLSLKEGDVTCDDVKLEESTSPAKIVIKKIPLGVLNRAGFTMLQTLKLVEDILPIGVGVESANFEGTFEFSALEEQYDNAKGFGSETDPTIGGFFGALISK